MVYKKLAALLYLSSKNLNWQSGMETAALKAINDNAWVLS
jgi:hypothetical protein